MKTGRNLNELATELYRQAQTKKDYISIISTWRKPCCRTCKNLAAK